MIERFGDPERGGFFSTSDDHEELIARRKEVGDHPIPSGNSSAALGLLRLAALTGERRYEEAAEGVFASSPSRRSATPTPSPTCSAPSTSTSPPPARSPSSARTSRELAAVVRERPPPHLVLAGGPEGTEQPPLLADRTTVDGQPAAYVCENFTCQAPSHRPELRVSVVRGCYGGLPEAPRKTHRHRSEDRQEVLDLVRRDLDAGSRPIPAA